MKKPPNVFSAIVRTSEKPPSETHQTAGREGQTHHEYMPPYSQKGTPETTRVVLATSQSGGLDDDAQNLFKRGHPQLHLGEPVVTQRQHAFVDRRTH